MTMNNLDEAEEISMEKKKNSNDYSADSIQVLEGLEAVRKRPAMYIGDISVKGLHHLVYEVVDNSIDEALAGYCHNINVIINEDGSVSVADDGRGIPVGIMEKEQRSALEVVLTVLHAGGKFNKDSYKVSGGLHGVGVSCVNALSAHLEVNVYIDGKQYRQEYERGKPMYPVTEIGPTDRTGTEVTFKPDDTIFTTTEYNFEILSSRLRELSFLNKGIFLKITDMREIEDNGNDPKYREEVFHSEKGLSEFVAMLDENREKLTGIINIENTKSEVPVEVAMQYNTSFTENVFAYVNNINTIEGGTHLAGFRRGLTRTLKAYAEKSGMLSKLKFDISGDDFREGLTAVPGGKSKRCQDHCTESHSGRTGPPRSPQGP
jgi:DNA gyrase subunit B